MAYESLIAAAIGFAPAIALLLLTLEAYTYPKVEKPYFDDRKVFGLFALGMGIGAVLYGVSRFLSLEYLILGFLLEEAIKLILLNLPRFQKKVDTSFYGISLGLGMGSTIAFGSITLTLVNAGTDIASLIVVSLVSIQLALLHGATGGTIGIGVSRGRPWPFFGQAVVVHLAYVLLMFPFYQIAFNEAESLLGYASFAIATVFLGSYYYYMRMRMLPAFVSEALKHAPKMAKKVRKTKA